MEQKQLIQGFCVYAEKRSRAVIGNNKGSRKDIYHTLQTLCMLLRW